MKAKIKTQKGFIQIPLIVVIASLIIIVSIIGAGVVLYKQRKLTPLVANISEVFKGKAIENKKESQPTIEAVPENTQSQPELIHETISQQGQEKENLECSSCECPPCPKTQPCEPKEIIKEVPVEKIVEKPVIKEVIKEVPVEKIVYKEICSCPTTQPSPTDEFETAKAKVEQNELFPLITGYKDSKGYCRCSSGYNNIDCSGCPYFGNKVRVGETIRMEVSAIPSKNSPVIEYQFEVNNIESNPVKGWGNENFAEYTVPNIPYSSFMVTVLIRNDYPQRRSVNDTYDDYIQILYEVTP